jgi:hypothetical protein
MRRASSKVHGYAMMRSAAWSDAIIVVVRVANPSHQSQVAFLLDQAPRSFWSPNDVLHTARGDLVGLFVAGVLLSSSVLPSRTSMHVVTSSLHPVPPALAQLSSNLRA